MLTIHYLSECLTRLWELKHERCRDRCDAHSNDRCCLAFIESAQSDTICYVLYCSDFIEIAERSTAKRFPNCIPELPPDIEATPAQELQRAQSW